MTTPSLSTRIARAAAGAALALGLAACSNAVNPSDRDAATDGSMMRDTPSACGREPRAHRASATVCPSDRPEVTCNAGTVGPGQPCMASAECTMGTNGRCVGNPHDGCRCSYDECQSDRDCPTNALCACRHPTRRGAGANVCLPGNCRTDADCGSCGFCSPSLDSCGDYGGVAGYYCHTPRDECTDDEDCAGYDAGFLGQRPYCMYDSIVGHWKCSNMACAG